MKPSLKCLICLYGFLTSCAQKVDLDWAGDTLIFHSGAEITKPYMPCNQFSDETFKGYVWNEKSLEDKADCVILDITKHPEKLLKNDNLFLQIYPFSVKDEIKYGSSLPIQTITKGEHKMLLLSEIIDAYIVTVLLEQKVDPFFSDHFLKICNYEEEKWDGLQLVIYERRSDQPKPTIIRTSKFLLPPFLVHPVHFRELKGSALAAFHPFLGYISEYQSDPSQYYDLAENICRDIL